MFPPGSAAPLRVDFFGDEIETIRTSDASTQRSTGRMERFTLRPVSELHLDRDAFVATATAIALGVDAVRIPVYLAIAWRQVLNAWPAILSATSGVILGTLLGVRVLRRIPEPIFRKIVSLIVLSIGVGLLVRSF